jgi:hypothetical protein
VIAAAKNIIASFILSLFLLKGIAIQVLQFSLHTSIEFADETSPADEPTEQKLLEKEFMPVYAITNFHQPWLYSLDKIWNPHYHDFLLISFLPVFTPPPENA